MAAVRAGGEARDLWENAALKREPRAGNTREEVRQAWMRLIVVLQFAIPGILLVDRLVSGHVTRYGWGWQMFSFG